MADRRGWVLALLIGLIAVLGLLAAAIDPRRPQDEPFSNRSIFNARPSGYKAWHLAAEKSGLSVTPWRKPFSELSDLPQPATMVIIEPYTVSDQRITFSPENVGALLHWVGQGNTLIVIDDFRRIGTALIPDALDLPKPRPAQGNQKHYRLTLSETAAAAGLDYRVSRPVLTESDKRFFIPHELRDRIRPLWVDVNHRPAAVEVDYRQGQVILATTADLASNRELHAAVDNYQLFTNLVSREHHPVFINEAVHGYGELTDIFAYYRERTPLDAVVLQLLFAFAFMIWLSLMPWRPRRCETPPPDSDSGGMLPYVRSLASLYWRQQASTLALSPALERIEGLLRRRHRLGLDEAPARLQSLLASLGADYSSRDDGPARWLDSLQRARQVVAAQQRIEHRELLKLARHLAAIEELLKQGHPHDFSG